MTLSLALVFLNPRLVPYLFISCQETKVFLALRTTKGKMKWKWQCKNPELKAHFHLLAQQDSI